MSLPALVVDDRTFVLGLCELYREQMSRFEETVVLPIAERACADRGLGPAPVAVEGYYARSENLSRLFRLVRTLQTIEVGAASVPDGPVSELRAIYASPAFGRPESSRFLLPRMTSVFGDGLASANRWTVEAVAAASAELLRGDEADLMAVACSSGDPVAICVARESLALAGYVMMAGGGEPAIEWRVSDRTASIGDRFVRALADCTGLKLPPVTSGSAARYLGASRRAAPGGRCVAIGRQPHLPQPLYHWYIDDHGALEVIDFWSSATWTTTDMQRLPADLRPARGARVDGPPPPGGRDARPRGLLGRIARRLLSG